MSPRLLCVYQHAPTPGAPGIYRHRLLLSELVRRGWHVDLVSTPINYMTGIVPERYARRPYLREEIDGITHHWVLASGRIHGSKVHRALNYVTFAAAATACSLTLPRPDVVYASSPPLTVGVVGRILALRHRRPWLLEVRDLWPESAASVGWLAPDSGLYRALDVIARRLTSTAPAVVVPTPGLVPLVKSHGAERVEVITNAIVDTGTGDEDRGAMRDDLGVDEGETLFAYAGAVGAANGLDLLLDAVARLPEDVPARVVIAGDGSDRSRLQARLAAERLDRVRLLGAIERPQVRRLLAAADVSLHVLRPDEVFASALPTKVLESFGAHRPFVTTVPGLPEQIARESGGTFAPTIDALAAALAEWAALSPEARREKGEQAFRYGQERFGLAASVDRLEAVLDRLRA
jgi:colanic acid biosynthesis glycosyl transferase WcaI